MEGARVLVAVLGLGDDDDGDDVDRAILAGWGVLQRRRCNPGPCPSFLPVLTLVPPLTRPTREGSGWAGREGGRRGRPRRSKQRSPAGLDWAATPSCVLAWGPFPLVARTKQGEGTLCGVCVESVLVLAGQGQEEIRTWEEDQGAKVVRARVLLGTRAASHVNYANRSHHDARDPANARTKDDQVSIHCPLLLPVNGNSHESKHVDHCEGK